MNAMSVSPVKPPLNPGSHSVPATATNLTKPPLPSGNNFTPLNLIPDAKPVPSVTITASPEKSVDLCSKPPTSNGTVFPLPESNSAVCPLSSTQNCVENSEIAENLSTNSTQKNVLESASVEIKPASVVEDKKSENVKVNQHFKEDSAPARVSAEKEIPAQIETVTTDVPNNVDDTLVKEEKKESAVKSVESIVNNVDAKPVKVESVPENKNEAFVEQEKAAELDAPVAVETLETEPITEEIPKNNPPKATKRKAKPATESVEDDAIDRKSKRVRLPTQPYQSPIPELQLIAKLNTPTKSTSKNAPERIIAFFKNEFLAVRNPEGSFYICQTFQNIHKSSTKIKIRWFTNLPLDVFTPDFYDTTEFDCILTNVSMTKIEKDRWKLPDHERTRIENILKRALDVEKGVVDQPSVTEEHPDGLDLSLFKDEAQLKKRKKKPVSSKKKVPAEVDAAATAAAAPSKKKAAKAAKAFPKSQKKPISGTKKSPRLTTANQSMIAASDKSKNAASDSKTKKDKKDKKKTKSSAKSTKKTSAAASSASSKQQPFSDKANSKSWEPSVKASNSSRVVLSLKKENAAKSSSASGAATAATTTSTTTSTATNSTTTNSSNNSATATSIEAKSTKRTSSVSLKAGSASLATSSPPQKRRKEEPKAATFASTAAASTTATTPERTGKVRNAGSAVTAKINSAAMRTTKEKERKSTTPTSAASNQRKK